MRACVSYNQPEPHQTRPTVVMPYPFGKAHPTVCVDACLVQALRSLWAAGIETFGSCCRHGEGSPEVIIGQNATDGDVTRAREALARTDDRDWAILSWTLVRHKAVAVRHLVDHQRAS